MITKFLAITIVFLFSQKVSAAYVAEKQQVLYGQAWSELSELPEGTEASVLNLKFQKITIPTAGAPWNLLAIHSDNNIVLWDPKNPTFEMNRFTHEMPPQKVLFIPKTLFLVTASKHLIYIWSTRENPGQNLLATIDSKHFFGLLSGLFNVTPPRVTKLLVDPTAMEIHVHWSNKRAFAFPYNQQALFPKKLRPLTSLEIVMTCNIVTGNLGRLQNGNRN